jgi:hypothetical protein
MNLEDDPNSGRSGHGWPADPQVRQGYLAHAAKDFSRRRGGSQTERSSFVAALPVLRRVFTQPTTAAGRGLTIGAVQTPGGLPRRLSRGSGPAAGPGR